LLGTAHLAQARAYSVLDATARFDEINVLFVVVDWVGQKSM
jgi:hypothetical protein